MDLDLPQEDLSYDFWWKPWRQLNVPAVFVSQDRIHVHGTALTQVDGNDDGCVGRSRQFITIVIYLSGFGISY